MGGRSLTPQENQRVVDAVRELLRGGLTQVELARRTNVGQSAISSLLAGRHHAGYGFARAVAVLAGISLDALLSGKRAASSSVPPAWHTLPGFDQALADAQSLFPHVPPDAWAWVGEIAGVNPPAITPVILGQLAQVYASVPQDSAAALPTQKPQPRGPLARRMSELIMS